MYEKRFNIIYYNDHFSLISWQFNKLLMIDNPLYLELQKNAYKRGYEPPKEQILLSIQGQNIGSIQNYIIISGGLGPVLIYRP